MRKREIVTKMRKRETVKIRKREARESEWRGRIARNDWSG